ncbi:SH3 domain-containing protein [Pedobacter sp. MW01-1-1]|uniref:SH3 domain-containing protein n=1 Tax=Pedobacter sp. MW01-1-1 TaxID=3383027 RepID=UPI003FEDCF64
MNKILSLFFSLFLVSFFVNAQDLYRVNGDKLNVREKNDAKSKIIGFVHQDDSVAVTDASDAKFYKIKFDQTEGWVSKDFLVKIASKTTQTTVAPAPAPQQKTPINYPDIIICSIVILLSIAILVLAIKFFKENKVFIGFSSLVVLITAYFCYVTFFKEKMVSGVFRGNVDAQYKSFNFKKNNQVEVKDVYTDSLFTTNYVIEGDLIKLQEQQNTILLLILDDKTLVGEGFTKGTFVKN